MITDLYNKLKGYQPIPTSFTGTALNPPPATQQEESGLKPWEPTPEAPAQPSNPWGYDEPTMAHLKSRGIDEESLRRTIGQFDPANYGTQARQWYEASTTKPAAPDEKKIRNAKNVAMIGDTLALLGQMWTSGRGAHERGQGRESSALAQTDARVERLRELYRQDQARYEDGLYNAGLRDMLRGMDQHTRDRTELRDAMVTKQKMDQVQAQFEARQKAEAEAAEEARRIWEAEHGETVRMNTHRIQNDQKRTAIAGAAEARLNKGGKSNVISLALTASDKDPNARVGSFGQRIHDVNLTPEEYLLYYYQAIGDEAFIKANPEFKAEIEPTSQEVADAAIKGQILQPGMVRHNDDEVRRIVTAYVQRQYDMENEVGFDWMD
jgi:hypothetical protein